MGAGAVSAERGDRSMVSARGAVGSPPGSSIPSGTPDAILTIDMTARESWDTWNSSNNEIFAEVLGAGAQVTGVGWDLTIATVPETGSWLWDAVISLYSSHPDSFFLDVSPGAGDGPGTADYSSGGVIDLGSVPPPDGPIPNLPIGTDGELLLQLWEDPDDVADAVDADYTRGTFTIAYIGGEPVPAVPLSVLTWLALLLLGSGAWLISRRTSRLRNRQPS